MHYATLYQVRQYLRREGADPTVDDNRLIQFINEAVRLIDNYKGRRFDCRLETRYFDYPERRRETIGNYSEPALIGKDYLRLDDDLLAVSTLTNGDGTSIASTAYTLHPKNLYPKHKIELVSSSGVTWLTDAEGDKRQVISLTGYWGYHDRYNSEAWEDSLDTVQDDPLTSGATTLTVSDADGVALDGSLQRFQAGQMLKIESEFLLVSAVSTARNVLTVKRGYNGTTAASHVKTTPVYIWRPMANIVAACTRLVAWRYRQKDVDVFDKSAILGTGLKIIPSNMPPDVVQLLGAPKMMDISE